MDEVRGTCMTMCPADEIRMRERNKLLHPIEMIPETRKHKFPKADRAKMVKEYTRPAAGKMEPALAELRPAPVLLKTVQYLIEKVVPVSNMPWCRVYEYVFDRLRAIRQDMVVQRINGAEAVAILEIAIRFYIYSAYALCEEEAADFDAHINNTHIQECLKRLLVLYTENDQCRSNTAEFVSLYLLYNLGNGEALESGLTWKSELNSNETFKTSLEMCLAAWLGNTVRVFKIATRLPPMHLCAFHRHIAILQKNMLRIMSSAYNSKTLKFNIDHLTRILWFNDVNECTDISELLGQSVVNKGVIFNKANFKQSQTMTGKYSRRINSKLKICSVTDLML